MLVLVVGLRWCAMWSCGTVEEVLPNHMHEGNVVVDGFHQASISSLSLGKCSANAGCMFTVACKCFFCSPIGFIIALLVLQSYFTIFNHLVSSMTFDLGQFDCLQTFAGS